MKIAICDNIPKNLEWLKPLILQCENCPEETEFPVQFVKNLSIVCLEMTDICLVYPKQQIITGKLAAVQKLQRRSTGQVSQN